MIQVLVADDPEALPVVLKLAAVLGIRWDSVIAPPEHHPAWRQLAPCKDPQQGRDLLLSQPADLVCTATDASLLAIVKTALGSGSRLTLLPDVRQTADWAYSLYPQAEESPEQVRAWFIPRSDRALSTLRQALREGRLGTLQHATWETTLPSETISHSDIDRRLFLDVDLLRHLFGEFDHLTTVPVDATPDSVVTQSVTLTGHKQPTVTWTIRTGQAFERRIAVSGAHGRALLLEASQGESQLDFTPPLSLSPTAGPEGYGLPARWHDVLRAFDYVSAARRSIRRRRTIDLRAEAISEKAQFKTLMSATGCGLLLWTLFGVVLMLVVASALDPRDSLQRSSQAAGLILWADDYPTEATLPVEFESRLLETILPALRQTSLPILIEQSDPPAEDVDATRRLTLVEQLDRQGVPQPASRVEVRELRGRLFAQLVFLGWVFLFLPLGVFLIIQLLVTVAREPRHTTP